MTSPIPDPIKTILRDFTYKTQPDGTKRRKINAIQATQAINNELTRAERKAYKKGQLNPACHICKKPLKLAAHYHQKCWSKSIDQLKQPQTEGGE